jgi:predicted TIM-barrel fold metal-dependent hydrolase
VLDPAKVADAAQAVAVVEGLLARGFTAVRLCPDHGAHRYSLANQWLGFVLGACADHRLPALVETSAPDWAALETVLVHHPSMPVILTGVAYRQARDLYPLLDAHPSLHVETSTFLAFGALEEVAERFGAHRLLFGTNAPVYAPGAAIARVLRAELPVDDIRAVAGGNLDRLLSEVQR